MINLNTWEFRVQERILEYLQEVGHGIRADQILSSVLNIRSPNLHSANKVLAGILEGDPRFVFSEGLWQLSSPYEEPMQFDYRNTVILHLLIPEHGDSLKGLQGAVQLANGSLRKFTAAEPIRVISRLCSRLEGNLLVLWSVRELRVWNGFLRQRGLNAWHEDTLYLRNLAVQVLRPTRSSLYLEEVASELGLIPPDEQRLQETVRFLGECWSLLMGRVPAEFKQNPKSLNRWINVTKKSFDFSHFAFSRKFLRQLPSTPGLYIMKNRAGDIIYVGKSRNLRRRVSSYFTSRAMGDPKTARIHEQLHSIHVSEAENEIEALLLETRMIRDFRPPINLQTEIHETHASYGPGRNVLLFVVDAAGKDRVQIYFLRDGVFSGRQSALLGRPPAKRLRERLKSFFLSQSRGRKQRKENWEKEIVARWFAANRKRLNYLDIDQAGDYQTALKLLHDYLCDPEKLSRKVYYR